MAFNAYLMFHDAAAVYGESTSEPEKAAANKGAIEITDYGFGVSMPVTTSRSDGGGATVGRANFDVFTCSKNIDTSTCRLVELCTKGISIDSIVLHLYRQGEASESGVVKYAMIVFQHCVVTKVAITGSGEELPKESLEFNYGICEYHYQYTDHKTGKPAKPSVEKAKQNSSAGWSTIKNKEEKGLQKFDAFMPETART